MIGAVVRQGVDTGKRQRYATALADLWSGLAGTLARLEAIADDDLDEAALDELPSLQYSLHRASELAVGIVPPTGAEGAHAELRAALADARDATGDMAAALEEGGAGSALLLVHEWRGALFRVRLARHRLAARPAPVPAAPEPGRSVPWRALAGALCVTLGAFAFTVGAVVATWPLWAAGLALVAGGFFVYRP
jgi:hypothetical protein